VGSEMCIRDSFNGIFELLVRTKLRVKSVQATEPTLEEAFLSLTKRGE